jgi:hypothetical protein
MAKSGFKVAVGLAKSINREIDRAGRAQDKLNRQREIQARRETRLQDMQARKEEREHESKRKLTTKLATANEKEHIKAKIAEAKEAYAYRCEERKLIREQMINMELK